MIAFLLAACFALEPDAPVAPVEITAVAGQGGLTAGLDASGALSILRWPNAGGPNLIRATAEPGSIRGGRWGIEINGKRRWLGDSSARSRQDILDNGVIRTTVDWPDGVSVTQHAAVLPAQDVFVSTIAIRGVRSTPRALWLAAFTPTTHQVPEAAAWETVFETPHLFVAFVDRVQGRVWNFRPAQASKKDWATARKLASAGTSAQTWATYDDGVWIALSGSGPLKNAAVAESARETVNAIVSGATVFNAVVGGGKAAIEPTVTSDDEGGYGAWVAIQIGKNYKTVAEPPVDKTQTVFNNVEQPVDMPDVIEEMPPAKTPYATRHWALLRALRDPESGFTVRSVAPAQAHAWPREGVLAAWARVLVGDPASEQSIKAYLDLVRIDDRARKPYGSMPESVYTDGTIASPHFVVDDRGLARTLWVAEQWIRDRAPDERTAWVKEHWISIEAAAEFLGVWFDSRRGAPLWCADPIELSDAETQDRLFAAYAGMSAAIRLAAYAGEAVPETWTARQARLLELTEWVLATPGKWQVGEALILELSGLSDAALDPFYASTLGRLENPIGLTARHLAALLLESALLHRHAPEHFALPADRVLDDVLSRIGDTAAIDHTGLDSFASAQVLIALALSPAE